MFLVCSYWIKSLDYGFTREFIMALCIILAQVAVQVSLLRRPLSRFIQLQVILVVFVWD